MVTLLYPPIMTRQIGEWKWEYFENLINENYNDIPDNIQILVEITSLWVHYIDIQYGIPARISEKIQGSYKDLKVQFKNQLDNIIKTELKDKLKV